MIEKSKPNDLSYRLYLFRKAIGKPRYHVPAAFGIAISVLLALVHPGFMLLGLLATATGMYLFLERCVLRFPARLRPQFRAWFHHYERLNALTPKESGIQLRGSSVDPNFLLTQLLKMNHEPLEAAHFDHFVHEIEGVFVGMERKILAARETVNDIKRRQISREILEETQRVAASVENYTEAMRSVYDPAHNPFSTAVLPETDEENSINSQQIRRTKEI